MTRRIRRCNAEAAFRGAWKQLLAVAGMPDVQPGTLDGHLSVAAADRDWDAIEARMLASGRGAECLGPAVCCREIEQNGKALAGFAINSR